MFRIATSTCLSGPIIRRSIPSKSRRIFSTSNGSGTSPKAPPTATPPPSQAPKEGIKYAKTSAGTGAPDGGAGGGAAAFSTRGPVTWPALGLVAIVAGSAVAYYRIERERRLENAMGKIVSSESGWSPNPELLARRQYVRTKWGWFPKEDAFGGGSECIDVFLFFVEEQQIQLPTYIMFIHIPIAQQLESLQLVARGLL